MSKSQEQLSLNPFFLVPLKKKCTLKTLSTHHGIFISSKNDHSFPIPYHEREVMLFTNSWLHRKTGRNQRNEPAAMFTCSME